MKKVAIVTGGSREIGAAIAMQLGLDGYAILLNHYGEAELAKEQASLLREKNIEVNVYEADLSVCAENIKLVDACIGSYGRLDCFIANAGLTLFRSFLDTDEASYDTVFDLNLKGSYFGAQAAARQMIAQGTKGRIIFSSSVTGLRAFKDMSAYGITKAALQHMARTLSVELAQHHITVNTLGIGAVLNERNLIQDPNYASHWSDWNPIGRPISPEDVAKTVSFLASEHASAITGQTIVVDGGWTYGGKSY